MDLDIISDTIKELESKETTFFNCQNLAYLYIVRDHYNPRTAQLVPIETLEVQRELSDILPQYKIYKSVKKKYQMSETSKSAVTESMRDVCREITEFIETLISCSDMPEEREQIKTMIYRLNQKLSK